MAQINLKEEQLETFAEYVKDTVIETENPLNSELELK